MEKMSTLHQEVSWLKKPYVPIYRRNIPKQKSKLKQTKWGLEVGKPAVVKNQDSMVET